jgi:hypothetical protein
MSLVVGGICRRLLRAVKCAVGLFPQKEQNQETANFEPGDKCKGDGNISGHRIALPSLMIARPAMTEVHP